MKKLILLIMLIAGTAIGADLWLPMNGLGVGVKARGGGGGGGGGDPLPQWDSVLWFHPFDTSNPTNDAGPIGNNYVEEGAGATAPNATNNSYSFGGDDILYEVVAGRFNSSFANKTNIHRRTINYWLNVNQLPDAWEGVYQDSAAAVNDAYFSGNDLRVYNHVKREDWQDDLRSDAAGYAPAYTSGWAMVTHVFWATNINGRACTNTTFVNGLAVGSDTAAGVGGKTWHTEAAGNWQYGAAEESGGNGFLTGKIDEFAVWELALLTNEIREMYFDNSNKVVNGSATP